MADFRPFRALRYNTTIAGDAASLVAPPYDVVSDAERESLYGRSAYNISRVDYGEERPSDNDAINRYLRAKDELDAWREDGVLRLDDSPRLYVYDQEFLLEGERKRRRAVFGRLRLEEWEKGIVLPHEVTGAAAKADRLHLLQAARVHLSPILALYRPEGVPVLLEDDIAKPVLDAVLPDQRHTLRPLEANATKAFAYGLADKRLYVADGHHRYETALSYRDERRAAASSWSGEEPESFVLAAVVAADDPGLVVLPTHRLIKLPNRGDGLSLRRLIAAFSLEDAGVANDGNLERLMRQLGEAGKHGPAFGVIGLEHGRLHLLLPRDLKSLTARLPSLSPVLRTLDVTVLQNLVLPYVGFDDRPENIDYTEEASRAAAGVANGDFDVAFLLNPTPVEQVFAVADAGERMPRKSTFFYPKLATGVVMMPLD